MCRSDAFGKGNDCGVGGWPLPNGTMLVFPTLHGAGLHESGMPVQADANLDISSYETLAQCFVLLCFWRCLGGGRLALQLPALSDNGGRSQFVTNFTPLSPS